MRLIDADALLKQIFETTHTESNAGLLRLLIGLVNDAPTVNQWISVDDRLPDKCNNYLVYFGKSIGIRMKTACWLPEKRIWKGAEAYSTLNGITHWMPLPEPPEEVTQND